MLQLIPAHASAEDTAAVTPTASSKECTVKMIWRYSSELRRPSDCATVFGTTRVRPSDSRKVISGVHVNAPGISRATQKTHRSSVSFGERFRRISARSVAGVTVCELTSAMTRTYWRACKRRRIVSCQIALLDPLLFFDGPLRVFPRVHQPLIAGHSSLTS